MAEKQLGMLEQVEIRAFWEDEARDFTPWLAGEQNLALLSSAIGIDVELQGTEVPVGPYKADIVARDSSSDSRVVIENQIEKTNHEHLGKALTYASGLNARIVIWIAKEFSEEHRRAIDFLNENAAPNLNCFGIEIALFKIGGSLPAAMFKVVASPNEYTSSIKTEEKELTKTKSTYLEFWNAFKEYCKEQGTFLSLRKARPQQWYRIAVGRSKFNIAVTASVQKRRIGCEIYMRGVHANRAFKLLEKKKESIELTTGPMEWQELPEGQDCRIVKYKENVDVMDKSNWAEALAWLKTEAEQLHSAFSPQIKALPVFDEFEVDVVNNSEDQ